MLNRVGKTKLSFVTCILLMPFLHASQANAKPKVPCNTIEAAAAALSAPSTKNQVGTLDAKAIETEIAKLNSLSTPERKGALDKLLNESSTDPKVQMALVGRLGDSDPAIQSIASKELIRIQPKDPEVLDAIYEKLNSKYPSDRTLAAETIAQIDPVNPSKQEIWAKLRKDPIKKTREVAQEQWSLIEKDKPVLSFEVKKASEEKLKKLKSLSKKERLETLNDLLEEAPDDPAFHLALVGRLADPEPAIQSIASKELIRIQPKDPEILDPIYEKLNSKYPSDRGAAAETLAQIDPGNPNRREIWTKLSKDSNKKNQKVAQEQLSLIEKNKPVVSVEIKKASEEKLKNLKSLSTKERKEALNELLDEAPDDPAFHLALVGRLADPDPAIQSIASKELIRLQPKDPEILDPIYEKLNSTYPSNRAVAAETLAQIDPGNPNRQEIWTKLRNDPNKKTREVAQQQLRLLGVSVQIPAPVVAKPRTTEEILADSGVDQKLIQDLSSPLPAKRANAVSQIARTRPGEAALEPVWVRLLESTETSITNHALDQLKQIGKISTESQIQAAKYLYSEASKTRSRTFALLTALKPPADQRVLDAVLDAPDSFRNNETTTELAKMVHRYLSGEAADIKITKPVKKDPLQKSDLKISNEYAKKRPGDPELEGYWVDQLKNPSPAVKKTSFEQLILIRPKGKESQIKIVDALQPENADQVSALLRLLSPKDPFVIAAILKKIELKSAASEPVVVAAIKLLDDIDANIRVVRPALLKALRDKRSAVSKAAKQTLFSMNPNDPEGLRFVREEESRILKLQKPNGFSAAPAINPLKSESGWERTRGAEVLAQKRPGDPKLLEDWSGLVDDPEPKVRLIAISQIFAIGHAEAATQRTIAAMWKLGDHTQFSHFASKLFRKMKTLDPEAMEILRAKGFQLVPSGVEAK